MANAAAPEPQIPPATELPPGVVVRRWNLVFLGDGDRRDSVPSERAQCGVGTGLRGMLLPLEDRSVAGVSRLPRRTGALVKRPVAAPEEAPAAALDEPLRIRPHPGAAALRVAQLR